MDVEHIMSRDVQTCTPDTSLPQVARLMWERNCGIIPVIDARGRVAGVVTDRDISMTLLKTTRRPINVPAREAMTHPVHACLPQDDVGVALRAMAQFHVRRLPVIGPDGLLEGILSLDDIVVAAVSTDAPTSSEILEAMRTILIKEAEEPEFEVDTVI